MVDLNWCKKQKEGIKLIESNENLAGEYLRNAEETLFILREINGKSNMWSETMKYYFEYFCIYSILMKLGIKCEIHDCTIKLSRFLVDLGTIPEEFFVSIKKDKDLRIDNQYYLKNRRLEINYENLSTMLLKTKEVLNKLTSEEINDIRGKI